MARQVLDNGVILPSEYSDDWYDDMTSNLTKLDEVIGSDAEKLDESDVGAAALSNDYDDLNNLPGYGILRFCSTAITDNSNIAFANISSVSKIAAGDFLLDTAAKLYQIASIDTANETVTVGTALIDLAKDSDVVHTSGNETVGGQKTFANNLIIVGRNTDSSSAIQLVNSDVVGGSANGTSGLEVYGSSVSTDNKIGGVIIGEYSNNGGSYATIECNRTVSDVKTSNTIRNLIRNDGSKEFSAGVDNDCKLGHPYFRWSGVYATNYYYGANNVEFSTKFVTTDTNQTISGAKTFSSTPFIYNSDTSGSTANLYFRNQLVTKGDTSTGGSQLIRFSDSSDKMLSRIQASKVSNGSTTLNLRADTVDTNNNDVTTEIQLISGREGSKSLSPQNDNAIDLGRTLAKWKNIYSNQINGLTPSSLSLPTDNIANIIDISGYLTNLDGTANTYIAPSNGYIGITMNNCTGIQAYIPGFWGNQIVRPATGALRFFMPICKNMTANILIFGGTIDNARFFPCQGNI